MNPTQLLGIDFYRGTYQECLREIEEKIQKSETALIVTPNPEMLYEAGRDSELLNVLQKADMALPDGAGIFVGYQLANSRGSKLLKYLAFPVYCARAILHSPAFSKKYGQRITGSKLTQDLIVYAAKNSIPVTILDPIVHGNSEGDKAKKLSQSKIQLGIEKKYLGIQCQVIIADTIEEIAGSEKNLSKTGIIFATHGNARQEKLLSALVKKYPNCGIVIGVGGSIDLITGFRSPAPLFFRRFGGEWLYRLYKNPSRHWKRMKKVMNFLTELV